MPVRFARRPILMLIGSVALVITMANPAAAPPGDLDTSFDGDGKVTTDFSTSGEQVNAVAIQGDGRIVAAGVAVASGQDHALARYNIDGSLDTTFDTDGKVVTNFAAGNDQALGMALQADGKIVTAGAANGNNDFAVARYNTDGSLDTTFDTDGKVTTDFAADTDQARAVAIQGDGKIVAAGLARISGDEAFALARYNPDGSLDTSFDTDGKVTTDLAASSSDQANGVAIQGDGRILAAGVAFGLGNVDFALARYNSNGSLDTTFDTDGRVNTDFAAGADQAEDVKLQSDGKIVATGRIVVSGNFDFGLARYNSDGSLDTAFDSDGKVNTDFGTAAEQAFSVVLQANGKMVAAGCSACFSGADFALARYNANGSLDTIFSGDGKVTTDFAAGTDQVLALAIQTNGRIVAAGSATVSGLDFALARYTCLRRTSRPMSIPICP